MACHAWQQCGHMTAMTKQQWSRPGNCAHDAVSACWLHRPWRKIDCCTQIDGRFALSSRCCSQVHCKMGTGKQNFSLRQRRPVPKICTHRHPDGWFSLSSHCCSQGPCKMDMCKQQISLPQHRLSLGIASRRFADDLLPLCIFCWSLTARKQDRHIWNSVPSALLVVSLPAKSPPCWACCLPAFYLLARLSAFLRRFLSRLCVVFLLVLLLVFWPPPLLFSVFVLCWHPRHSYWSFLPFRLLSVVLPPALSRAFACPPLLSSVFFPRWQPRHRRWRVPLFLPLPSARLSPALPLPRCTALLMLPRGMGHCQQLLQTWSPLQERCCASKICSVVVVRIVAAAPLHAAMVHRLVVTMSPFKPFKFVASYSLHTHCTLCGKLNCGMLGHIKTYMSMSVPPCTTIDLSTARRKRRATDPLNRWCRRMPSEYLSLPLYLSISPSLSFSPPLSISPSLSIYLSIYLSIHPAICPSISPSTYLSIQLSIYLSVYLSLSLYLSTYLSIHPSIHPSIHLSSSIYLSPSLCRTPQIGGVGGTRALAHSIIEMEVPLNHPFWMVGFMPWNQP